MAKITERNLREIIQDVLMDELKEAASQRFIQKDKGLTDKEMDLYLFHGGDKDAETRPFRLFRGSRKRKKQLSEGEFDIPPVNRVDIESFRADFENKLPDATVIFDNQENGEILSFPIKPSGLEVYASGIIDTGRGKKIGFEFSLLDGLKISSENLEIDEDNKDLIEQIYNIYSDWEKEWRAKVNPNAEFTDTGEEKPIDDLVQRAGGAGGMQNGPQGTNPGTLETPSTAGSIDGGLSVGATG